MIMKRITNKLITRSCVFYRIAVVITLSGSLFLLTACGNTTTADASGLFSEISTQTQLPVENVVLQGENQSQLADNGKDLTETQQLAANEYDSVWQEAYIGILNSVRAENTEQDLIVSENDAVSYCLYDIDKDNVPELILQIGDVEASRSAKVFSCPNGSPVLVSEFYNGHSTFYSCPCENGVIVYWVHMGSACASKYSLQDSMWSVEELFSETVEQNEAYTDIQEYVPDSSPLDVFSVDIDLPILTYRVMERYSSGDVAESCVIETDTKEILLNTIYRDGIVYGANSNRFGHETGLVPFSLYLQPGMVEKYADKAMHVSQYAWMDMNHDGDTECVLRLDRDENDSYTSSGTFVILSLQGETVYAYPLTFFDGTILENGVLVSASYQAGEELYGNRFERVLFRENECFTFHVISDKPSKIMQWTPY